MNVRTINVSKQIKIYAQSVIFTENKIVRTHAPTKALTSASNFCNMLQVKHSMIHIYMQTPIRFHRNNKNIVTKFKYHHMHVDTIFSYQAIDSVDARKTFYHFLSMRTFFIRSAQYPIAINT